MAEAMGFVAYPFQGWRRLWSAEACFRFLLNQLAGFILVLATLIQGPTHDGRVHGGAWTRQSLGDETPPHGASSEPPQSGSKLSALQGGTQFQTTC